MRLIQAKILPNQKFASLKNHLPKCVLLLFGAFARQRQTEAQVVGHQTKSANPGNIMQDI